MIYLIGGAPRCGKSTVAKLVAKEHGATCISADALEGIAYRYTPPMYISQVFPKTVMRQATGNSNDEMYALHTKTEIVDAYLKQSQATWPAVESLAASGIAEGQSYVIEGHQVHPALISSLIETFGDQHVRGLVMFRSDAGDTVSSLRASQDPNDWVIAKSKTPAVHGDIALMIVAYGRKLRTEAKRFGVPIQGMDGDFWKRIYEAAAMFDD